MDTKSHVLVAVTLILIAFSAVFTFNRYVIHDDFEIYQNDNGLPEQLE